MTATLELVNSFRNIPLDLVDANPLNPRKTFDEGALKELAASIKEVGILNPLLVRPVKIDGLIETRYEIIAGHRRSEAATLAGLEEVPCIVREMSDAEAADAALIDNLQRKDVEPMEEAEAFGRLLERMTGIPAVAMRVGKDLAYVAKRLKLRTLGLHQRDALRLKLITIDHALLLARLGLEEQDAALKWCLDPLAGVKKPVEKQIAESAKYLEDEGRYRIWEPESVVRLREHIEQETGRKLARAPWSLDDVSLIPEAGACNACPSNTKANVSLFGDLDIDEATCAAGGCFQAKTAAFIEISLIAGTVKRAGADQLPLRVSWKETSTEPRWDVGEPCDGPVGLNNFTRVPKRAQILKAGQWVEAKKGSCKHAEPAVTVDWSDDANRGYMGRGGKLRKPGEALLICAAPKCKVHPKSYEKAARSNDGRRDPAAEKAAEEKRKAAAIEENKLRMAFASAALESVTSIPGEALRVLAVGRVPTWGERVRISNALIPGLKEVLQTATVETAEFAKALAVVSLENLAAEEYQGPKHGRDEFIASIRRLGYKGETPWDKPKEKKPAAKKVAKKAAKKGGKK